jgi:hypothetical protein
MQYLSGDDLLNLEKQRLDLIKKTIPTMPIFPIDLFGRSRYPNHYPEIVDLKINAATGVYDVIAATNWDTTSGSRCISVNRDLYLDSNYTYLIFDFWNEHFIGEVKDEFEAEIPAHDTRTFLVHRKQKQPQLLATNRHISGAFSIKKNVWNQSEMTLNGISETVPGAMYSLYFFLPGNFMIDNISVEAKDLLHKVYKSGLLKISFTGQEEPVNWQLKFTKS